MRFISFIRISVVAFAIAISGQQAFACSCGMPNQHKNAWENAESHDQWAIAIFEGIPEHSEVEWNLMSAKNGELIPTDLEQPMKQGGPHMVVTFRVQRAYKGALGSEVQLMTGFGGGDCGAGFTSGLTYLVYASGPNLRELGVNMCSPGGWVESKYVAADLRHLRKERPISGDLTPPRPWTMQESPEQEQERQRDAGEFKKQYEAVTGRICGTVVQKEMKDPPGFVSFLSTNGYSPVEHPNTSVERDGSFCSGRLGPGKYNLYFEKGSYEGLRAAIYYPGVVDRSRALSIEISAGQTQSNIEFNVPVQRTYSVRGLISTNDKSGLNGKNVDVGLFRLDGDPRNAWYTQLIDFNSNFPLPKTKYFNFENVLPGHYIAYVSVDGKGWYTKKVDVDVTNHMKFISLELIHKK